MLRRMRLLHAQCVYAARDCEELEPGVAKEVFEVKSPEEIRKGLECCVDLEGKCFECPYNNGHCDDSLERDALAYIQQLEEQQPRWISVKDRLPEPDQEVLLIAHGWRGQLLYIGRLHHEEAETSWLTGITTMESEWRINGWSYLKTPLVTHWMPLPELPEEE